MVLNGQMMTDSWAAIKKQRTCKWPTESYAYTILADAISISVTSQATEAAAVVGALDALNQRPFPPHNLLNMMSTTLFHTLFTLQLSKGLVLRSKFPYKDFPEAQPGGIMKEQ